MARNRHKKSQMKAATPAIEHTTSGPALQSPLSKPSPAAQKVANQIASGGVPYLMENAERILIDSARLADEPEFADLFLNRDQAAKVTERWFTKYEKRLKEAERKGKDEYQQVFDDMRIEIIDELATPAFRKDVKNRLRAMYDRLIVTSDAKKIEMAMILQPLLDMKKIPWGLCGLIIAIYSRTMEKEMKAYQESHGIFEELTQALEEEGAEKVDFLKIMKSPNKLEQLSQKIFGKNPGLRERVEEQIWKRVDDFEEELSKGEIALDLFTREELLLPLHRLQEELGMPVTEAQPGNDITKHVFDAISQTINDIMTPERYRRLRKDVESTAKAWMRQRNKWAASLQAELTWLEEDTYEENPFLLHAFIGQIRRSTRKQNIASKSKK